LLWFAAENSFGAPGIDGYRPATAVHLGSAKKLGASLLSKTDETALIVF
jgi:hypothetical protein